MGACTRAHTAQGSSPPLLARQLHFVTASEQPRLPAATAVDEACRALAALAASYELGRELLDTPVTEGE